MKTLHSYLRACLAALLMLAAVPAEAADVKELFAIDLADYPGKEGLMIEVSYPPGAQDMVHRHNAHAFVYVLEGQIVMQVKGQPAVTLKAGQTFYEGPTDIHVVGRNASSTEPARFVVVLLKAKGAPVLTPVTERCSAPAMAKLERAKTSNNSTGVGTARRVGPGGVLTPGRRRA
jgi:quercetin dioxygenase-like cupin family protein